MNDIVDWDVAAANNNSASPNGAPEGMNPSGVNDSMRENMAVIARWYQDTNGSLISAGTDTITLTAKQTIAAYAQGQIFVFEAGGANTGAATLDVDSVGAKAIVKNFNAALVANDIKAGQIVMVAYEASADNFQMLSNLGNADAGFANPMTTQGDIIRGGASGAAERLAAGTLNQVLIHDTADALWGQVATAGLADNAVDETKLKDALIGDFSEVVVAAGDSFLLGDVGDSGNTKRDTIQGILDLASGGWGFVSEATPSGAATAAFTNMVTGYDYLYVGESAPATDAQGFAALLGIAGPTYRTSGYKGSSHAFRVGLTTTNSNARTASIDLSGYNIGNATDEKIEFELLLMDPVAAGTDTHYLGTGGGTTPDPSGMANLAVGHYTTSEAHTSIQFKFASGNMTGLIRQYRRANA